MKLDKPVSYRWQEGEESEKQEQRENLNAFKKQKHNYNEIK